MNFELKNAISELLSAGLVYPRFSENGELLLVKYNRKVFYKNLWDTDKMLLECRGIVFDKDFNVVNYPFTKIFNLGENGAGGDRGDDEIVTVCNKVNGFMACATNHHGSLLVTTTGSFSSDYQKFAEQKISENSRLNELVMDNPDLSFMFEVTDREFDPHIIIEKDGVWFLGAREKHIGSRIQLPDEFGQSYRSPLTRSMKFSAVKRMAKTSKNEGYVVYFDDGFSLKLKTPFYLTMKFIGRGKKFLGLLKKNPEFAKQVIDEEFYDLVDYLASSMDIQELENMSEQERYALFYEYFESQ